MRFHKLAKKYLTACLYGGLAIFAFVAGSLLSLEGKGREER